VLAGCGSDKPAASDATQAGIAPAATTAAGATQAAGTTPSATQPATGGGGGNVDCTALKVDITDMTINWQVVLGLVNSPTSEWAAIPIGTLPKFGDQLAELTASLSGDSAATDALSYMKGANDIVVRGVGGDTAAQADLGSYLGTDITANVSKQVPISVAYQNAGCS